MFDPFLERIATPFRVRYHLLGSHFSLESNDRRLIRLAAHAFKGLPRHRFPGDASRLKIRLILQGPHSNPGRRSRGSAPELRTYGWNNVFCATIGPDTVAVISPETDSAFIIVSRELLAFPHSLRYELIEHVVFMLASRRRNLIPLHGACVALDGHGLLLLGNSGAGKSVTSLACLADGFEFVAEDGLFVCPATLLTSGLASFLHLRMDSLQFFHEMKRVQSMRKSPTILRRSGVPKLEVDLRKSGVRLARTSVEIRAIAFLSGEKSSLSSAVTPIARTVLRDKLEKTQPYAASLPQWRAFIGRLSAVPAYSIARGEHPKDVVTVLRAILQER